MEQIINSEVNKFWKKNKKKFPEAEYDHMLTQLNQLDEKTFECLKKAKFHSLWKIDIVSCFLGDFGIDRFLIGDVKWGIIKLILCWSIVPWLIDWWFLIERDTKKANYKRFCEIVK